MGNIRVGAASAVINNELGTDIQAATHLKKVRAIRDDLEANALWLEAGDTALLLVTCDLIGLQLDYVQAIVPEIGAACGVAPENILIGCSHTHAGPAILGPTCPGKPLDTAYLERLRGLLIDLARRAAADAAPARLAWGRGEVRIGYNRRCCWADGTHTMHGDTTRPDFTGLEGNATPQHIALFAVDEEARLKAILYHNTAHVTTFFGADFLSADFPGVARGYFRDLFGPIPVLFFNGPIGDISLEDQMAPRPYGEPKEQKMARAAHLVVGETLRLLHEARFSDELDLRHRRQMFEVGIRLPSPERLAWAEERMATYRRTGELTLEISTAYQTVLLHEQFAADPREIIPLHAVTLGELAFVTVPCELYTHFAHRIMARSPFPTTALLGLVNGDMGYCPTLEGILGGHWGGEPMIAARWDAAAGYRIVDEAVRMLVELKRERVERPGGAARE